MNRFLKAGTATILATIIVAVVAGQTKPVQKKKAKAPSAARIAEKRRADSLATTRADSLKKAFATAFADSVRHDQDSVARRADSLKAFEYRTVRNEAFTVGERLVFDVNYGFITAGEAVMQVAAYDSIAGRSCYRVEFNVTSLQSFSWIYKVEDRYLTFIDVGALAPLKFEQHIREGTYRRDFTAEFDQAKHIATTTEGTYPVPEYVQDIMSSFYYVRTLDFTGTQPGQGPTLFNFYKDKSNELRVKFLGRQELEVTAGTFRTIVVEPLVREGGLFKSEGRIVIWLTDDDRKIPIRVNTKVPIGSIDTELREYSGLAGPVKARIK